MKRGAIAAAWVLVALARPAGARALALPRMPIEPGAMQGMCEVPALLAHASASSVEFAVPVEVQQAVPTRPQTPIDDGPIAWCATPDDPRCSSRDAGSPPDSTRVQAQLNSAGGIEPPAPRVRDVAQVFQDEQLGAALAGKQLRVERPPRSD